MASMTLSTFDGSESASNFDDAAINPPLLQPMATRMISCLRAPCLKRTGSHDQSSPSIPSSGSVSPAFASSPQSMALSLSSVCSFASIKKVISAPPKRQVHFDASPPEAGVTYSRDNYDRRPIECTRGGSFDMSLPPRGKCPKYSGEADDEACDDEADSGDSDDHLENLGVKRWAKLKNGNSILGGAALKLQARQAAAQQDSEMEANPNVCRLPVHGIRSFGGLAGSIGHSDEVRTLDDEGDKIHTVNRSAVQTEAASQPQSNSDHDDSSDPEHIAFRQAVYAALSMSPNATPMPSPSVRMRWECVSSYFDQQTANDEAKEAAQESIQGHSNMTSDIAHGAALIVTDNSTDETPSESSPTLANPTSLSLPRSKLSPSPSYETSTNPSSSPMSSRCSSTDTWSSHDGTSALDAGLESAFKVTIPSATSTQAQDLQSIVTETPSEMISNGTIATTSVLPATRVSSSSSSFSLSAPAFLLPPFLSSERRSLSQSAPASAIHSPCMLSADEGESETPVKHTRPNGMQRSISCTRKVRKTKRVASSGDCPADSDDAAIRPRRTGAGQRSKSVGGGGALGSQCKKSSLSLSAFRSEIEDEGALGGF